MKAYDFINSSIGNKVYITNDGDLSIDRILRNLIFNKTELLLKRLTPGGMAVISDENDKEYKVPPRNVREVGH